jgi:hypothetical protein
LACALFFARYTLGGIAAVDESGYGKTTTSCCILRALTPIAGAIRVRTEAGEQVDVVALSKSVRRSAVSKGNPNPCAAAPAITTQKDRRGRWGGIASPPFSRFPLASPTRTRPASP